MTNFPKTLRQTMKDRGGLNALAVQLGISRAAISQWQRVPAERVLDVERITGIPRIELRPDLYAERAQ